MGQKKTLTYDFLGIRQHQRHAIYIDAHLLLTKHLTTANRRRKTFGSLKNKGFAPIARLFLFLQGLQVFDFKHRSDVKCMTHKFNQTTDELELNLKPDALRLVDIQ